MDAIIIAADAFPLVRDAFSIGSQDTPSDVDTIGARQAVENATCTKEGVRLEFPTEHAVRAFRLCVEAGAEGSAEVSDETWDAVFRPLLKAE